MTTRTTSRRQTSMTASRLRSLAAGSAVLAACVAGTTAADAATTTYIARTIAEPPGNGLAVTGELSEFAATSKARVLIPTKWRSRSGPAGQRRYTVAQNPSCRYELTYTVRSLLRSGGTAAEYVASELSAASARHLLDSGERGNRAFRVVRQSGGSRVRVDAIWAGVLTRRDDIAPAGQVAYTEIRVSARSTAGSECHAGTWRESLGPTIGDTLAAARTSLRFVRRG